MIYYRVPDSDDEDDTAPRCLSPQSERSPGIHPNSDSEHDENESGTQGRLVGLEIPSPPSPAACHAGDSSAVSLSDARCGTASPRLVAAEVSQMIGLELAATTEPTSREMTPVRDMTKKKSEKNSTFRSSIRYQKRSQKNDQSMNELNHKLMNQRKYLQKHLPLNHQLNLVHSVIIQRLP